MTARNDSNLPINSHAAPASISELAKQAILEAKNISERSIDANTECSLRLMGMYEETVHTINQQLLQHQYCQEKENRLETQRKECLNSALKVQKSTQRSTERSRAAYYRLAAGLTLAFALAFLFLCQSGLLSSLTLDSPEETCYTELYDIDAEEAPQNLS